MSEVEVQKALYGPDTRSGEVHLTPLRPCSHGNPAGLCHEPVCEAGVYIAAHDPRGFQPWVELWMDWETIEWFPDPTPELGEWTPMGKTLGGAATFKWVAVMTNNG